MNHKILDKVGNTPVKLLEEGIYVKLESFNPSGSIKDRAAAQMIIDLLEENKISKDTPLVEATSGNTGIGLAYICNELGMSLTICMPSNMSKERIDLIKKYNANILLTDSSLGMPGAIAKAKELEKEGYYYIDQFNNKSNVKAHYLHTSREIEKEFGDTLDYIVAGVGTGGTISGIGKYYKQKGYKAKIIAVEPLESAVLNGKPKGSHKIQGIGAGFIPPLFNKEVVDEIIDISSEEAIQTVHDLNKIGFFLGISSGAAISAARKIKQKDPKAKILAISPDGGEKYISLGIYDE